MKASGQQLTPKSPAGTNLAFFVAKEEKSSSVFRSQSRKSVCVQI